MNTYQLMGLATVAGLIVSIIAHEVAHAIIAEYYDMPIESITFFIFGGVAEMKGEPSHPKGEFLMAISGPAMSALMALFFWATADFYARHISPGACEMVLNYLGKINMLIVAFNMIPAFPLDGGRALRALIWKRRNNLALATRIASDWGQTFSYGLIALAFYQIVMKDNFMNGMWLAIFGYFMHEAGTYAVKHTGSLSLLTGESVSRFLQKGILSVSPHITINDLVDQHISQHYQRVFPVIDKNALVGVITLPAVLSLDRSKWPWLHVGSLMQPLGSQNFISPDSSASDAFSVMQKHNKELLLVAQNGNLMGAVFFRDLTNYLNDHDAD